MANVNATLVEGARDVDGLAIRATTCGKSALGDIMVLREHPRRRRPRAVLVERVPATLSVLKPLL